MMKDFQRSKAIRNLIIYLIGVLSLSVAGAYLLSKGREEGALIFIISPALMAVLLRFFGRDGWSDAGMRSGKFKWYIFALLAFPVVYGIILGLGLISDTILFKGSLIAYCVAMAGEIVPRMLFSATEELGWRGYIEPRLALLGIPDLKRHIIVGFIWALWHVPYMLNVPVYSELSTGLFVPLFISGVLVLAVVYGQLFKQSGSVWPVVIIHGLANSLSYPLIFGEFTKFKNPALLSTRPENITFIVIFGILGWMLLQRGRKFHFKLG